MAGQVSHLDGGYPVGALRGGQAPPLAPHRRIKAVHLCSYGLPEEGCGHEGDPGKLMDKHF